MSAHDTRFDRNENAQALCVWENEGGALRSESEHQFGRRKEPNSSWTTYHVFTGVPVSMPDGPMTGLSKAEATAAMMCLNARNGRRRTTDAAKDNCRSRTT